MTANLVHLVRAPRSAIVHVSQHAELTLCGRNVPDSWSTELMEPAGALERASCDRCRGYSWTVDQRPAAVPMPQEQLQSAPSTELLNSRGRDAVRRLEQNRRRGELVRAVQALPGGRPVLC